MSEFTLTKEKIQELLPSLDAITELYVGSSPKDSPDPVPFWVIAVKNGDYQDLIDVELRIVTGRGIHSVIRDRGMLEVPAVVFMPQDYDNPAVTNFTARFTELANNLEFRHRAKLRAESIFK